jgi:CheY-like chemotaxis protein
MPDVIFQPITFRSLTVKNRVFRSNISGRLDNYDGSGTQTRINWELKFARGGAGAIISSFVPVHPRGRIIPNYATIVSDDRIPFWRALGEAVHQHDCKYIMQLSHGGRQRDIPDLEHPKGQSSTDKKDPLHGFECKRMTLADIKDTVNNFAEGARRAREMSGFEFFDQMRRGKINAPPFVHLDNRASDPRTDRAYFAKAMIYSVVAAPFVRLFGTTVQTGWKGVLFSFGRATRELEPGFHMLIPFVQRMDWWQSGVAGAFPSMACYVAGCVALYRLARIWLSPLASSLSSAYSRTVHVDGILWCAASAANRTLPEKKSPSVVTSSAPARSWTRLVKAASKSASLLAFTSRRRCPIGRRRISAANHGLAILARLDDLDSQLCGDVVVQLDRDLAQAELLDGLREHDLLAIDLDALLFERGGNVFGSDRSEEPVFLADFAFDIIITDINMPIMDGLKLVKRVRSDEALKGIPIIIITTEGAEEDRERGLALGANAYISKPIQSSHLIKTISELLAV